MTSKPSSAFVGASWLALGTGMIGYIIGLWRSGMQLNEKGYYFTTLMYGLFSVVSLQKAVRDRLENIPVTDVYHGARVVFHDPQHRASDSRIMECGTPAE